MTIFDAKVYDQRIAKRIKSLVLCSIVALLVLSGIISMTWNWRSQRVVVLFFSALEAANYQRAYGIWCHDAIWYKHSQLHSPYTYSDFIADWGPNGEFGTIKSFKIRYMTGSTGNTVLFAILVKGGHRGDVTLAVSKTDHTLSFSPFKLVKYRDRHGWIRWGLSYQ